jgi:hypothetical protein
MQGSAKRMSPMHSNTNGKIKAFDLKIGQPIIGLFGTKG